MKNTYPTRSASTVHQLYLHMVFVCKGRSNFISDQTEAVLQKCFAEECRKIDCLLINARSDENHVHLLIKFPPKVAIATLANRLKSISSYVINRTPATEGGRLGTPDTRSFWTPSYFVKSVGAQTIGVTNKYLEEQGKEAAKQGLAL